MPTLSRNIIISVVLAIAAGAAIFAYTSQVRSSADRTDNTISVLVVTHEIPASTNLDDAQAKGWIEQRPIRQSEVAAGALSDPASITGRIATQTLYEDDQLTRFRVGAQDSQTAAGQVTGGFRAIRVPFNPNSGLLRDLQVDDHVDVITSYRNGDTTSTYLAVPNAQVISVDAPVVNTGNFASPNSNAGSLLLQVTEQQALILAGALASSTGNSSNIWVVAVGRTGATYAPLDPIKLPGKFPNHGVPAK
jgi:Flp pilus assembly protein CpaB